MISFVWSSRYPLMAGTGGSENYTIGHVRELLSRNIPTRIITLGHGKEDGRIEFPDIEFMDIGSPDELAELDDTIIYVSTPLDVKTKNESYTILHVPPTDVHLVDSFLTSARYSKPIVTSHHAAAIWSGVLDMAAGDIPVVYPFAEEAFAEAKPTARDKTRVLYAGRLTPDKGLYTFLWSLHSKKINFDDFAFSVTTAGAHTPDGKILLEILKAHPYIEVLPARKSPEQMAKLMADTDILVIPSSAIWWDEMFGIVSIEAQHAGCRVVASNSGGLPETNCGGLILVDSDNPRALEEGILQAANMGRLTFTERKNAATKFTLRESVDKLLNVINYQK